MKLLLNLDQWFRRCHLKDFVSRLPLAIFAICYKNCRVATKISHRLKVYSSWLKKYIFEKRTLKCIFNQHYDFPKWLSLFIHS